MIRLAVIGDPVAHSKSPELHRVFLREARLLGSYEAIRIRANDGARAILELREAGYTGLNVTTPLKEEAFAVADARDPAATASGAVNTLVLGRTIVGYNTDGAGALGALAAAGMPNVAGRSILVLGAGPTARATIVALAGLGAHVRIWNRTTSKAERIAADLPCHLWSAQDPCDAVFSTLLPGSRPSDEALFTALQKAPIVIDANYGDRATLQSFLARPVHDGKAMLEAGAKASFRLFTTPT